MGKKLILTEQQHTLIVNQILKETVDKLDELEAKGSLDEGFWDTIKYGLSKLGRYKAGGKIMGKGKVDQEYARKIQQIIDKEGNDMIKQLDAKIREANPEFPNSKDPQQFLTTVMEIAAVYDSVVAATQKQPEEEGYMPIDAANGIINDLREYTKKFLDVDLAAVYSGFNEAEDITGENIMSEEYQLSEGQMCEIDEAFDLNEYGEDSGGQDMTWAKYKHDTNIGSSIDQRMMAPFNIAVDIEETLPKSYNENDVETAIEKHIVFNEINREVADKYMSKEDWWDDLYYNINDIRRKREKESGELNEADPLDAADVRAGLQAKRGGGDDFASDRMDTLKSNKLPLILAGVGASLGALGWIAQSDWFRTWLESLLSSTKVITNTTTIVKDVSGGLPDKQGFVHWASDIFGKDIKTGADMQQFINKFGAENVSHMFDGNGGGDSMGQMQKLQQLISGNPGASMGDLFNKADQTFGSMSGGQNLFGISKAASFFATTVTKQIAKTVVKTGGAVVAGKIAGLGAILSGVGIGLLATGALVKLVRMKGQKSSRAATLNTLYQSMRNLEGGVGIVEPDGDTTGTQDGGTQDGGTGQGGDKTGGTEKAKTNLYNNLKNLFQFIVNNKNTMGTKTQYNTGTGGAGAQAPLEEAKYITDKRVIQYISKSLPFDKLKNFENLLNRIEIIRNSLKKMGGSTGDKALDGFLKQLDSNPIMLTNFEQLTKVDPNNAQEVNQLLAFIKETLLAVYSGDYKVGNMVDKMSTLGGGNINKLSEDELEEVAGYSAAEPNKSFSKDAQSRTTFKKNLVKFLSTIMNMFQYLHKTQGGNIARKDTSNKYTPPPARQKQTAAAAPAQQSGQSSPTGQNVVPENLDPKLMEEIKRIKKIMLS
jgi:hypothetical protein